MIGSLPSLWPWKYKNVSTSDFIQNMYIPENYFLNSEFNQGILFFCNWCDGCFDFRKVFS